MSKKSRRQRQRTKQRNYAQVNNPNQVIAPTALSPTPAPATIPASVSIDTHQSPRRLRAQNQDLWDALIFSGAIFVSYLVLYYVNQQTPLLENLGSFITRLFGVNI